MFSNASASEGPARSLSCFFQVHPARLESHRSGHEKLATTLFAACNFVATTNSHFSHCANSEVICWAEIHCWLCNNRNNYVLAVTWCTSLGHHYEKRSSTADNSACLSYASLIVY
jgi:hypothetical protein